MKNNYPYNKKPKKKLSFYVVFAILILTILGSCLGSVAFFKSFALEEILEYPNLITSDNLRSFNNFSYNGITINSHSDLYFSVSGTQTTANTWTSFQLTDDIIVQPSSTYSFFVYATGDFQDATVSVYANGGNTFPISNNEFFSFTVGQYVSSIFLSVALPSHLASSPYTYNFNLSLFVWLGDWNLSTDLYNSISYQIGYEIGRIQTYDSAYNDGFDSGYNSGFIAGSSSFESSYGLFDFVNFRYIWQIEASGTNYLQDLSYENFIEHFYPLSETDDSFYMRGKSFGFQLTYDSSSSNSYDPIFLTHYQGPPDYVIFRGYLSEKGVPINNYLNLYPYILESGVSRLYFPSSKLIFYFSNGQKYEINNIINSQNPTGYTSNSIYLGPYRDLSLIAIDIVVYGSEKVLSLSGSVDDMLMYNEGYQNGYYKGLSEQNDIIYNNGYAVGYDKGVREYSNYSFFGLLGSVVDVPVQALSNLFNFEIFGTNFSLVFYFFLTLTVVMAIVRFLL